MSTLRIEFYAAGGLSPSAVLPRDPIGGASLSVTSTPTASGSQVAVPASSLPLMAVFTADAAMYVDIDPTLADPTGATKFVLMPGAPQEREIASGAKIGAVLATDITSASGGGDASAANQVTEQGLIGALTETAPSTDTASSGLNGRLQRIAQRLSTIISSGLALAAGEAHVGEVSTPLATPSANVTRPGNTTAYASGQLVANSTTAGSVTPLNFTAARVAAGSFVVRRARLKKSGTTVTNASFRLHLYDASPTCANGDGGAWSTTCSGYLGSIDLDMSGSAGRAFTDAAQVIGTPAVGSEIAVKLASGQTIYGLLEARAAYTPANAETFTVTLELLQN